MNEKKFKYSMTDRNELIRKLLADLTDDVNLRENLKQIKTPVPSLRTKRSSQIKRKPVPTLRKSVKNMVQEYENNIILPPPVEFADKPTPAPRTKKLVTEKPVRLPRTKIGETNQALKSYTN